MTSGRGNLVELITQAPEGAVGFATGPARQMFVRVDAGQLLTFDGRDERRVEQGDLYDVRLYGADRELRWWYDQELGEGRWGVIDDHMATERGWHVITDNQHRLIRGNVVASRNGWSRVEDGNAAPQWVPVEAATGAKLAIGVVEYDSTDPLTGSVGVVAERYTTIGVQS